ncbi:hypothetical protein DsansV1_C27g0196691 [Dioscorea sansibarensis]
MFPCLVIGTLVMSFQSFILSSLEKIVSPSMWLEIKRVSKNQREHSRFPKLWMKICTKYHQNSSIKSLTRRGF